MQTSASQDVENRHPPLHVLRPQPLPRGSASFLPLQALSLIHPPPQESLPLQPHPAVPPCSPYGLWGPPATLSPCPQICRACARPRRHWAKAAWPAPSSVCTCSRESCTLRRSGGGLGAGEGVRKGAGPELGDSHSRLMPAGFAEAGPDLRPALPPTPRTRRVQPSGRPGHSR